MPRGPERLIGFIPTIKKPNGGEAFRIIIAQAKNPNRQIISTFDAGLETERTSTRIPYRDMRHGLRSGLVSLYKEMQAADFVQIIDSSER